MNSCVFYGRISSDVEVRYTQGDKPMAVANFSVAVNRRGKNNEVDFFRFTAFGKTAEVIEKYFKKGSRICINSHAQMNSYTDKDGNKRSNLTFIVDAIDFVDTKAESQQNAQSAPQKTATDDFVNIPDQIDSELPFS